MAAFSSFGFDESTQELLRRGAALTEMLKQQQFRPLPSEIQAVVPFNGIRERITPKQIRFYEYQVVPGLIFGLKNASNLSLAAPSLGNSPTDPTTLSPGLLAVTETLPSASLAKPTHSQANASKLENRKGLIENEIALKCDNLGVFVNLLMTLSSTNNVDEINQPKNTTYLYNLSFVLPKIASKYNLLTRKASKNVDDIFNVLTTFSIGG